uniref:(northern house mosquito) hypothetical protein n=1 Tax=Culex pipiens TaxID=7175 RepID=A0A8D8C6B1_CULPI
MTFCWRSFSGVTVEKKNNFLDEKPVGVLFFFVSFLKGGAELWGGIFLRYFPSSSCDDEGIPHLEYNLWRAGTSSSTTTVMTMWARVPVPVRGPYVTGHRQVGS